MRGTCIDENPYLEDIPSPGFVHAESVFLFCGSPHAMNPIACLKDPGFFVSKIPFRKPKGGCASRTISAKGTLPTVSIQVMEVKSP
jgi:hypothetical protein